MEHPHLCARPDATTFGSTLAVKTAARPPESGGRTIMKRIPMRLSHGGPAGTRTQDPRLKRPLLYQLSYRPLKHYTYSSLPLQAFDAYRSPTV